MFKGRRRGVGVLALLTYAVGFSLAYGTLDAGLGALILFGMVQVTMFAAAVLGRDEVPVQRWIGGALAFGGLVWLLSPGAGAVPIGPAMAMALAGIAWGFYSLAGRGEPDAVAGTAANFVLAAPLGLLAWALVGGGGLSAAGVGLAVLSGAATSGMGYALWYRLVPLLGASPRGGGSINRTCDCSARWGAVVGRSAEPAPDPVGRAGFGRGGAVAQLWMGSSGS